MEARQAESKAAHLRANIVLIKIPALSPDLNPVEKYWSWLRRRMSALDLADLVAKRAVLGKTAYRQRLKRVIHTPKSKEVAGNIMKSFLKTCRKVSANGGEASGD